jgi:hypothetical protein
MAATWFSTIAASVLLAGAVIVGSGSAVASPPDGQPLAAPAAHPSPSIIGHPEYNLRGRLTGSSAYPNIGGVFKYFRTPKSPRIHPRWVQVTVWRGGELNGDLITVFADDHRIGRMRVGSNGHAYLQHLTSSGQVVPVLSAGATVRLRDGGRLVASATLHRVPPYLGD